MQITITTYAELDQYSQLFVNDHDLALMIIEGNPGIGKSSKVKSLFEPSLFEPSECCWVEGRISPVCLYEQLYRYRDSPIVLDDVDGLFRDKDSIALVKALCQTWTVKTISWTTRTNRGTSSFETTSRLLLITNDWKALTKNLGAIQDRGILVRFQPDNAEIHRKAKEILIDDKFDAEVYDYIGSRLDTIINLSFRAYLMANILKRQGMDWTSPLEMDNDQQQFLIVSQLDMSENQKAKEFARRTGRSERTYWRKKQCG